jgi:hypothetical protein
VPPLHAARSDRKDVGSEKEGQDVTPAAVELDALLGHPALRGRWTEGFTSDDVLDELIAIGRLAVDVRDDDEAARFTCRLELRQGGAGASFGRGRSLTAAAIRCLLEAEAELAAEVERGLDALGELLEDA